MPSSRADALSARAPFLRIPPFPGHRAPPLGVRGPAVRHDWQSAAEALAAARVGGAFWAAQVTLPARRDIVLAPLNQTQAWDLLDAAKADGMADRAVLIGPYAARHGVPVIARLCDPWHLAAQASEVRAAPGHELALVAALLGKGGDAPGLLAGALEGWQWRSPFTGAPMALAEVIALLADWRQLIDTNRASRAVFGVALWKRVTMDALLWDGLDGPHHTRAGSAAEAALAPGERALAWKSRTDPALPARLASRGVLLGEIEDGFIRSTGLGANCVPPLSVIVDFAGAYFDPAQASGLEQILAEADMTPALLARAKVLRERLVAEGISKYGQDSTAAERKGGERRHVLVTGQVEDDRSMLSGGAGLTNLELLRRARALEPGVFITYKPHPDVEAGHRKGQVPLVDALALADVVEVEAPIAGLIDAADALHVITSLAGFEAVMRGKDVVVHGVPFYAGWGLTRDLGPVPARRGRTRLLDELVAATLLLYPRYLDPVTRLPCPAEVVVERMAAGTARIASPLVRLRAAQGRLNLLLQWFKARF